jgi:hypothetical protein
LGFQLANPAGFGRGGGGRSGAGFAVALFSKAAILSRKDPGLGFGGVFVGESDMVVIVAVSEVVDERELGVISVLCCPVFGIQPQLGWSSV